MSREGLAKGILLAALFVLLLAAVASMGLIRRGSEVTKEKFVESNRDESAEKARLTANGLDVSGRFDFLERAGATYVRFLPEDRT